MKIIETISVEEDITLISLHDSPADIHLMARVFEMMAGAGVDVDMISQAPQKGKFSDLSFTVKDEDFSKVMSVAAQLRENYPELKLSVSSGNCKISVYGEEMSGTPGVAAKVFAAAASTNADIRVVTTSDVTITLLVAQPYSSDCVEAIARNFE